MANAALYERRKSIKALDEDLLASGLLFLTGSHDRYGHPIAIFPINADEYLGTRYTSAHVLIVLRYYYSICYHGNETRGMAFVANLHRWKKESIKALVDALDMAQDDRRGTVGVLYAIQPKSRDLQKHFKKLTGLRTSKRNPKIPRYETVCVGQPSDLLRFMEVKHLTEDFAGSLKYNHKAWISFMKTMDDLEETINKTLDKLPEAHDKLSIMCEYDLPVSQSDAESLLSQIRAKYQNVMRDLNLEHMIDECKEVVLSLSDPHIQPKYAEIMHTPSFTDARKNISQYEKQLIKSREELKTVWQQAESRVITMGRVVKYKHKANQILSWLKEMGLPTIKEPAEIADCLSKAEILKTQYETGFLSVAKNVLWLSEKVQKKLDEAVLQNQSIISNLLPFSKTFLSSMEQFRKLTQNKYSVYLNVYDFYLTSHKLARWYRRTLKFIPVQLLQQQAVIMAGFHDVVFHGSSAWAAAVNNYLLRHPAPKTQHLVKLKNILPVIDRINVRNQARLLVHRVSVMCTLLRDPSKMKMPDMQGVLRWRTQILEGLDDITLNLDSSTLDLAELNEMSSHTLPRRPVSASGVKVAPKLKGSSLQGAGDSDGQYYSLDRRVVHRDHGAHRPSLPTNMYARPQEVPPLDLSFADYDSLASEALVLPLDTGRDSNGERYVSLAYMDDSGLPDSLKNMDILHDPRSQSVSHPHSHSAKPHAARTNKSKQLVSQPMTTESQLPSLQYKSLPSFESDLKETPPLTMDMVVNSNLEPEEKLDLMSRICLGEEVGFTPELFYKIYPNREVTKPPQQHSADETTGSMTLPRSHQVREAGLRPTRSQAYHTTRPRSAVETDTAYHPHNATDSMSKVKESRSRPLSRSDLVADDNVAMQYEHQPHIVQDPNTFQQPINRDSAINRDSGFSENSPLHRQSSEFPVKSTSSHHRQSHQNPQCHRSDTNLSLLNNERPTSGILRNKNSQQAGGGNKGKSQAVPGRRKPSKRSSIKVEEWMQRPEHQLEMTRGHSTDRSKVEHEDHTSLRQEEKKLNSPESYRSLPLVRTSYPQNAASSLADSDLEGVESDQVDRRLAELALEEAELDQDDLEISLQKTEQILQEQEELLKEFGLDLDLDLDLPASPNSTSSSTTLLNEEIIHATRAPEQQCPLVIPNNNAGGENVEPQREGSLSEESGVYTQSTDSRIRLYGEHAHSGSSMSLNHLVPQPHRAASPNIHIDPHIDPPVEGFGDHDFLPSNGHLQVTKEASLGDSSSQATVMTEIHRNQSLSSDSSRSRHSSNEHNRSTSRDSSHEPDQPRSAHVYSSSEEHQPRPAHVNSSSEEPQPTPRSNSNGQLANVSISVSAMSSNVEDSIYHDDCDDLGNSLHELDCDHDACISIESPRASPVGCSMLELSTGDGDGMKHDLACLDGGGGYRDNHAYNKDDSGVKFSCLSIEMLDLKTPVVLDNGSGLCKCGLIDQDAPSVVFPTLIGRPKYEEVMSHTYRDYVGEDAQANRGILKLSYPLEHGVVKDWDDMEKIWCHALYDQLRVAPEDHPIMLTEAAMNPRADRERILELMFDGFQAPAIYIAVQATLGLYATGRTTGVVLDSGDGVSHMVPIYQGHVVSHAVQRLNLAGRDVTHYLAKLLRQQGHNLNSSAELEIVRDMKEQLSYVAEDLAAETHQAETSAGLEEHYMLPDGHQVSLAAERFRCSEILFDPSLIGRDHGGLHEYLYQTVAKCDIDLRRELLNNVILSGGTTMTPGFSSRLHRELSNLTPSGLTSSICITSPDDRQHLVWRGGAVLAQSPAFSTAWVFRQEYDEIGPDIVHRKCF